MSVNSISDQIINIIGEPVLRFVGTNLDFRVTNSRESISVEANIIPAIIPEVVDNGKITISDIINSGINLKTIIGKARPRARIWISRVVRSSPVSSFLTRSDATPRSTDGDIIASTQADDNGDFSIDNAHIPEEGDYKISTDSSSTYMTASLSITPFLELLSSSFYNNSNDYKIEGNSNDAESQSTRNSLLAVGNLFKKEFDSGTTYFVFTSQDNGELPAGDYVIQQNISSDGLHYEYNGQVNFNLPF